MANEIKPALTADEWQRMLDDFAPAASLEANATAYEPDFFMAMAVANAALPDDDPRKITREDVRGLVSALERMEDAEDWFHDQQTLSDAPLRAENERKFAAERAAVAAVKEKLAALLPPNGH